MMTENFNLRRQMRSGVSWVSLSQFLRYFLQLIIIGILARLLSVDDFGIMAIVLAFMALSFSVGDLGLSAAIVQKREVKNDTLSSSLWVCVIVGLLLCILMFVIAPGISAFFNKAVIESVIKIISIKFIIDSFGLMHETLLRKELLFKKIAFIEISETLSFGLTSISLASLGLGVWSLVYAYIASSVVRVIFLWVLNSWRPDFKFSLKSLREFFRFAENMLGFKITSYLVSNVDRFIVGKLLGSFNLACYSMAYGISNFAREKLSGIVTKVGFPAFSKIQQDNDQLRRAYLKLISYASVIIFPLLCALIVLSPEFVRVIFTQKWAAMIDPLRYLAVAGMITSITSFAGIIFLATGHAELNLRLSLISLFIFIFTLLVGVRFGLIGLAIGICLHSLTINIISFLYVNRLVRIGLFSYIKALYTAIICSGIMSVGLKLFLSLVKTRFTLPDIYLLISSIFLGVLVYSVSLYTIRVRLFREMLAVFRKDR